MLYFVSYMKLKLNVSNISLLDVALTMIIRDIDFFGTLFRLKKLFGFEIRPTTTFN
jgi:hypothetical protein